MIVSCNPDKCCTPPDDNKAPVISLVGDNPQTIKKNKTYIELGATTDDGSSIIINSHVNINKVGTYSVTYDATDDAGNRAEQVIRTVKVIDTTVPVINLLGNNPQNIEKSTAYIELGAATDDGSSIIINSHVNINTVGTYSVTYDATDDAGNKAKQVIRTVFILPHMTISSSNNVVVYVDSDFDKKVTIWHKNFKIKHISKYLYRRFNDDFDFIFLISNNLTSPDTISYAGVYSREPLKTY